MHVYVCAQWLHCSLGAVVIARFKFTFSSLRLPPHGTREAITVGLWALYMEHCGEAT